MRTVPRTYATALSHLYERAFGKAGVSRHTGGIRDLDDSICGLKAMNRSSGYMSAMDPVRRSVVMLLIGSVSWMIFPQNSKADPQFSIGGTVSGFTNAGVPLQLFNNGQAISPIGTDGPFVFTSSSATYSVTLAQPPGETCTVANGSGTLSTTPYPGAATNVWISCQPNGSPVPTSHWTPLASKIPKQAGLMLLLSDGSVMVNAVYDSTKWYRLSPSSDGHYVNGTWTTMASSHCPHGDFASQVLTDGRVFIAGGEYPEYQATSPPGPPGCATYGYSNSGVDTEIYDPVADSWTMADPPTALIDPSQPPDPSYGPVCGNQAFVDMISETLPDGSVLMAPVCPKSCGDTLIFDPKSFDSSVPGSGWSFGGTLANTGGNALSCNEQEATWMKLPDGSILTADPPVQVRDNLTSERYIPSQHQWVKDTSLGFTLFDDYYGLNGDGEEGPAFLLPNGNALFIGGASVTGIYTPTPQSAPGSPMSGSWTQGAMSASGPATGGIALSADDAPGAMMANGKILLSLNYAATSTDVIPSPVFFFEYDPVQNAFTEVAGPGNSAAPSPWTDCGSTTMLDLPDGTVLMPSGCDTTQFYVYQPTGSPLPQGKPSIRRITPISNGSFHLTGTGLTGISEGSSYGDDAQNASNYPLVRLTDSAGRVQFARTYNWSSTGVMVAGTESTEFDVPRQVLTSGKSYRLQVVVNGNASAPTPFPCVAGKFWNSEAARCDVITRCPVSCKDGCNLPRLTSSGLVWACKPSSGK